MQCQSNLFSSVPNVFHVVPSTAHSLVVSVTPCSMSCRANVVLVPCFSVLVSCPCQAPQNMAQLGPPIGIVPCRVILSHRAVVVPFLNVSCLCRSYVGPVCFHWSCFMLLLSILALKNFHSLSYVERHFYSYAQNQVRELRDLAFYYFNG